MVLVSNSAIPECVWKLSDKFGLKDFFDVILVSGEINKRKPSPEIFEKTLNALGVDASKAVFVGDTLGLDVKGAKNVGIEAILIERRPLERILDIKPDKTNQNRTINQLKLYRKALSQRTNIPEHKFRLAFFNDKGYNEI